MARKFGKIPEPIDLTVIMLDAIKKTFNIDNDAAIGNASWNRTSLILYAQDLAGLETKARKTKNAEKKLRYRGAARRVVDHIALMSIVEANISVKEWREKLVKALVHALGIFLKALFTAAISA